MTGHYVWPKRGEVYHDAEFYKYSWLRGSLWIAVCGASYSAYSSHGPRPPPNRRLCLRCEELRASAVSATNNTVLAV